MNKLLRQAVSICAAVACFSAGAVNVSAETYDPSYDFLLNENIKGTGGKDFYKYYFDQSLYSKMSKWGGYDSQYRLDGGYTASLNTWMTLKPGLQFTRDNFYKLHINEPSLFTAQVTNPPAKTRIVRDQGFDLIMSPMGYISSGYFLNSDSWVGYDSLGFSSDPAEAAEQVKQTYTKGMAGVACDAVLSLATTTPDVPMQMKITSYPLKNNTKISLGKTYTKSAAMSHFQIYSVTFAKDSNLTVSHSSVNGKTHFFMWNEKYKNYNPIRDDADVSSQELVYYKTSSGQEKTKRVSAYLGDRTKFKVKAGTYYFVAEPTKDDTFTFRMTASAVPTALKKSAAKRKAAPKIRLSASKLTLKRKKTRTLKLTGTKKKVKWTSSNRKVATVTSRGRVKALRRGKATITAKCGGRKYTCRVTVK